MGFMELESALEEVEELDRELVIHWSYTGHTLVIQW